MNIEIYEDTYNIAVNQYLSRKTAGSKRRKEAFRSKKRRSRVLRDKYGFIADGKMLSKLGKSYYNGHAQCEEWRNRCVAKRKSNSCSYKTVSERRRIEMADRKMMEYIIRFVIQHEFCHRSVVGFPVNDFEVADTPCDVRSTPVVKGKFTDCSVSVCRFCNNRQIRLNRCAGDISP